MATKTQRGNGTKQDAEAATPDVLEEAPDIRHLEIPEIEMKEATLSIVGISPLIVHQWSKKAISSLEGTLTGEAKQQKPPMVPEEEWRSSAYIIPGCEDDPDWEPGKYYFPAAAFKHAFLFGVGQLSDVKNFPKSKATAWLFVDEDPVLNFDEVMLRSDITRNPTQMVYRPQFNNWSVELLVSYNNRTITIEQVVSLMNYGGVGGIGEWRPSAPKNKSGSFGRFRVVGVTHRS